MAEKVSVIISNPCPCAVWDPAKGDIVFACGFAAPNDLEVLQNVTANVKWAGGIIPCEKLNPPPPPFDWAFLIYPPINQPAVFTVETWKDGWQSGIDIRYIFLKDSSVPHRHMLTAGAQPITIAFPTIFCRVQGTFTSLGYLGTGVTLSGATVTLPNGHQVSGVVTNPLPGYDWAYTFQTTEPVYGQVTEHVNGSSGGGGVTQSVQFYWQNP